MTLKSKKGRDRKNHSQLVEKEVAAKFSNNKGGWQTDGQGLKKLVRLSSSNDRQGKEAYYVNAQMPKKH